MCCCLVADFAGNFCAPAPTLFCHAHPLCFLLIVKWTCSVLEGMSHRSTEYEDARPTADSDLRTGLDRNTIWQLSSYFHYLIIFF